MQKTLPKGWKMVRLGEVANYINGKAFKSSDWSNSGIPIIRIQNLTDNSKPFNYYQGECESKYHVDNRDILISWSASLGIFVWDKGKAYLNQHIFKAIPYLEKIDKSYFVYAVSTAIESMREKVHGATMTHIVKSEFNNIEIPLPPLPTQHKIVEILEETDNLRKLRQQADKKMKDLIPSLFVQMFGDPTTNPKGWEVKKLGEVASIIMGQSPTGDSYNEKAIGEPLLNGPAEFGTKHPQAQKWTTNPTRLCKKDDILICVRGNTTGRMNIADTQYCIGRGLAAVCSNQNMTVNSVLYSFLSMKADNLLREATAGGSTFPNINRTQLENLPFPFPPLPLQQEFAKRVEEIEAEKIRQAESKKKLNELFNSLMQRAFKGELVT